MENKPPEENRWGGGTVDIKWEDSKDALAKAVKASTSDIVSNAPRFDPEDSFTNTLRQQGSEQYIIDDKGKLVIQLAGRELQQSIDSSRRRGKRLSTYQDSERLPTKNHNLSKAVAERVTALVRIRDKASELFDLETGGAPGHELEPVREDVRNLYSQYNRKYGSINTRENKKLFNGGRDDARLFSLERYNEDTKSYIPADILHKRVIGVRVEQPRSAHDAMVITKYEKGYLDFDEIGAKLGEDPEDVKRELLSSGLIFLTPDGTWETASDYLSGDIREKLDKARIASFNNPSFDRNVRALSEAMPETIVEDYIRPSLGSPWISEDIVNEFIRTELRPYTAGPWVTFIREGEGFIEGNAKVGGAKTGGWVNINPVKAGGGAYAQWGFNKNIGPADILMAALQGTSLEVRVPAPTERSPKRTTVDPQATRAANEKVQEFKERFSSWIDESPKHKAAIVKEFNERFNSFTPRSYDGSFLRFPGMTDEWQKKAYEAPARRNSADDKRGDASVRTRDGIRQERYDGCIGDGAQAARSREQADVRGSQSHRRPVRQPVPQRIPVCGYPCAIG